MKMKALRFAVTLLVVAVVILLPDMLHIRVVHEFAFREGIFLAALAVIPVMYKLWQIQGDAPVSLTRWIVILVLFFVTHWVENRFSLSSLNGVPYLQILPAVLHSPWFNVAFVGFAIAVIVVRQVRFSKEAKRQSKHSQ